MTRPIIFLVLFALTLVVVVNGSIADKARQAQAVVKKLNPNSPSRSWTGVSALENKDDCLALLKNYSEDLRGCRGNLSTCGADLSVCNTNILACNASSVMCDDNLATCEANLEGEQATNEELTKRVQECRDRIVPTSPPDCSEKSSELSLLKERLLSCQASIPIQGPPALMNVCTVPGSDLEEVFPEVGVDCMAIRRRIEKCEMKLKNQQSRFMEMIQRIVGSRSTQAPTPAAQVPPARASPAQGSPSQTPAPPAPAPPAPDYTYHFLIFWLVVLVCFGFRIGPRMVRIAERRLRDASERRLRDDCARNFPHWHTYNPITREHQVQMQLITLRRQERNWSFFERFSRFLGFY